MLQMGETIHDTFGLRIVQRAPVNEYLFKYLGVAFKSFAQADAQTFIEVVVHQNQLLVVDLLQNGKHKAVRLLALFDVALKRSFVLPRLSSVSVEHHVFELYPLKNLVYDRINHVQTLHIEVRNQVRVQLPPEVLREFKHCLVLQSALSQVTQVKIGLRGLELIQVADLEILKGVEVDQVHLQ